MRALDRQATSGRARLLFIFLVLCTLSVSASSVVAQAPEPPHFGPGNFKDFSIELNTTYVQVPFLGRALIGAVVTDLSRDSTRQEGAQETVALGRQTTITVDVGIVGGAKTGWTVSTSLPGQIIMFPGETKTGDIIFATAGSVRDPFITVNLTARLLVDDGSVIEQSRQIVAQVAPFYQGLLQVAPNGYPAGPYQAQFETIYVPMRVSNFGLYYDYFEMNATGPEDYMVHVPPGLYVEPGTFRDVNVTIVTPRGKLFEFGQGATILVNMRSVNDLGTTYQTVIPLFVRGYYVPSYWMPLGFLALVCIGLVMRQRSEMRGLREQEKGRPRPVRVTPRQQAMLKELKRRDPDAFKTKVQQINAVYAARRKAYRERRKEEVKAERAEQKVARRELREEKQRRKAESKEVAAREAEERKAEKLRRKEQRVATKKLEAERAKVEKKRAKLQGKLDKKQAKVDKQQAKKDAAAAKEAAKAEKAAAKEAKRREKAASKGEKKAGGRKGGSS